VQKSKLRRPYSFRRGGAVLLPRFRGDRFPSRRKGEGMERHAGAQVSGCALSLRKARRQRGAPSHPGVARAAHTGMHPAFFGSGPRFSERALPACGRCASSPHRLVARGRRTGSGRLLLASSSRTGRSTRRAEPRTARERACEAQFAGRRSPLRCTTPHEASLTSGDERNIILLGEMSSAHCDGRSARH
jgi:hypothetical protein